MMNVKECAAWLNVHDGYLIITHIRPDGDTLGSAAALCSALRRIGKKAALYDNPGITPKYIDYVRDYIGVDDAFDNVIAVDIAEPQLYPDGFSGGCDLCIDHHPTNTHYAGELLLRGEKASCGEIILEVIKALCGEPTPDEASLLYIALSTDCGGFRYANVKEDTFAAAGELYHYGAQVQTLNFKLFRQMSRARINLEGLICSELKYFHDGAVVVATVTLDMMESSGATENDCDDIAGIPGKVEGCLVSMVVRELEPGKSKVSVRSQPCFDSSALCARFGGGGHKLASGCTIYEDPETAVGMLISALDEVWE